MITAIKLCYDKGMLREEKRATLSLILDIGDVVSQQDDIKFISSKINKSFIFPIFSYLFNNIVYKFVLSCVLQSSGCS